MSAFFSIILGMKYEKIIVGKFIDRPNRFVAEVEIDAAGAEPHMWETEHQRKMINRKSGSEKAGQIAFVHVKNTGRCRELLVPGATVWLEDFTDRMGTRKLAYSLIGIEKQTENGILKINMDSQAPNKVVREALESGKIKLEGMGKLTVIQPEKTYGNSRFDLYIEDEEGRKGYIEVKGVTLEERGTAYFPDAPTERGVKHIRELIEVCRNGMGAWLIFVVQMRNVLKMKPNDVTHRAFGDILRRAAEEGVHVHAFSCDVTEESLEICEEIPVDLT